MVLFNLILTVYMLTSYSRSVLPGLPNNLQHPFAWAATIHAIIGSITITFGVCLLLHMYKILPVRWRVSWWENLMLALYWITGVLGMLTYSIWYLH
jgi:hypothetical protein